MTSRSDSPPIISDYTLLRAVGRGAYGEVWLARSVTGVFRAIKIIRRASFSDDRPFDREFAGIKRFEPVSLGQDSQVSILHVGRNDAAGFYYYVMEIADDIETGEEIFPDRYVPKTLKELRARRRRLPASESIDISLALTRALAHLHAHDLVHRDIKPSNVIFVHGIPKLADIGLVSATDTSQSFVGTEGFVPPEGPGRAPADIFSLGKVIYEISTGQDRNDFPRLPDDLETFTDKRALLELNEVVLKACEADVKRRYATAESMREDLLLLQAGRSVRRLHLMEQRFAIVAKYGVAATIVTALAIGGFLWASAQTRRAERAEAEAVAQAQKASDSQQQSRRLLYASDMNLAQQALKLNNVGRALRLLERNRPQSGEEDLRGWEWRYLWQLTRSSGLVTLTNRPTSGVAVSFSPNGSRLAVSWWDGRVDLWDVPRRRLVRAVTDREQPHPGRVAFSPVRNLLAATTESKVVTLFNLDSSQESILWRAPDEGAWEVRDLAFSQDGSRVVIYAGIPYQIAGSTREIEDAVYVVNVSSGQIESRHATVYSGTPFHGAARLSPDNRHLYLARSDVLSYRYSIQCIELTTGREVWQTERERDRGLTTLEISPDGRVLASGSGYEDPTIHIWEAATGRPIGRLHGHTGFVFKLVFTKEGRRLISAASDQSIRVWDTNNWTETQVLRGHTDEVFGVAISEPAQLLASAGKDGNLILWKEHGKSATDGYRRLSEDLGERQVLPLDRSRLLLLPVGKPPELLDLKHDSLPGSLPEIGSSTAVLGWFATNILCHWDGTNQILVRELRRGTEFIQRGSVALDSGTIPTGLAYNATRQLLAWTEGFSSTSVYLANLAAAGRRIGLRSDVPGLVPLRFSDDGNYLAAWTKGAVFFRVWNIETEQIVASIDERVWDATFAAGGRVLVVAIDKGNDHEIGFYDLAHPDQASRRVPGRFFSRSLAVSPDGGLVASSTGGGLVRLLNPAKGELIEDLHGHLNSVSGLAFSPDGRRLISAFGGREAVKLWDVGTRQELLTLSGTGSYLNAARWSADGDAILAGAPWQAWRAPSWEEIAAAESGVEGTEIKQR